MAASNSSHRWAWWRRFHNLPSPLTAAIKCSVLLIVILLVFFPRPWLIPTWLKRMADMNSVIEPNEPALAELEAEVRARAPPNATGRDVLRMAEIAVYEHIPYAWDWETWGVVDWLPTTHEAFAMGRTDCSGRAVVAASLLRRMGYQASIVSDILHMWVETPIGDTMGPGEGEKTFVGGETGTQRHYSLGTLMNLARGTSFGIAAFPWQREIVIAAAAGLLALHPRSARRRALIGGLLLLAGLLAVRHAGMDAAMEQTTAEVALSAAGFASAAAGLFLIWLKGAGRPPDSAAAPAE